MFKIRERKVVKKLLAVISAMTLSAAALIQSPVNAEAAGFTGNDIAAKAVTIRGFLMFLGEQAGAVWTVLDLYIQC